MQNRLTRKRKKLPVTLIVGIVCKDAIALAADSQTTYGELKLPGTNKINTVDFRGGKKVLIAESGMVTLSNQAIDFIKSKAATVEVTDKESVSEAVKAAMFEVRKQQISLYPKRKFSLEEWKEFFRDLNPVELTVAYFVQDSPFLFTITLDECVVHWEKEYSASGIGAALGNYLLKELFEPNMEKELGCAIAIKITKEAATYIEGCDEPIKAALIERNMRYPDIFSLHAQDAFSRSYACDNVVVFDSKKVEELVKITTKTSQDERVAYRKKIHRILENKSKKALHKLLSETMSEFAPKKKNKQKSE